ncbi:hypothetical protein Cob_v000250 [Colletotrichum orbiculare MAFF 240422]|uniref:Uncharacterized protein n=1 Tax=Colletotrichum orbiculare (strain 104-T / ATCC 96160 / CBS 514.97 / LARS 414 / MAFF 240422) TaxID=1213857 RepID=A0A484G5N9_COLOR|nr:hypothetical protein Cob_v000250 [Colletotrichum orbiculare MAFF 240422]
MVDFNYPNPAEALADVSLFAAATSNFPRTGSSLRMSQVRGGVGKWHGTAWHVKAPSVESAHPWDAQIPTVRQTSLFGKQQRFKGVYSATSVPHCDRVVEHLGRNQFHRLTEDHSALVAA